jgi:hypothetical protein
VGVTARELAAEIAARVPQRALGEVVRMAVAMSEDTRDCGRCPRCDRALPLGSIGPAFQSFPRGVIGIPITPQERVRACLVDGPRANRAQDLPLADLVEAADDIRAALQAHGWKHWERRLARAIHATDAPIDQAEQIGQTLETLRRFGPPGFNPDPELDVLVTSFARYWRQTPEVA